MASNKPLRRQSTAAAWGAHFACSTLICLSACVSAQAPENRVENAQEAVRSALELADPAVPAWHCYPWTEWCFRSLDKCDAVRRGLLLTFSQPSRKEAANCGPAEDVYCYRYESPTRGEAEDCYMSSRRCGVAEQDYAANHGDPLSSCKRVK